MADQQLPPKRRVLDIATKQQVIKDVDRKMSMKDIMTKYGFKHQSNINRIVQKRSEIEDSLEKGMATKRKVMRTGSHPNIDRQVENWIDQMDEKAGKITRAMIQEKALQFASESGITGFKASSGWCSRFESRTSTACIMIHGEAGSVAASTVTNWMEKLFLLLKDYEPNDVFSADELGLFFKLLPARTHAKKGKRGHKTKESKQRVTLLVGSNMSGTEKMPLLMIGKSANPRCFASFRKAKKSLPIDYCANQSAWMTMDIFASYVLKVNNKMKRLGRKILLLLDNAGSHNKLPSFSNVNIQFLPKNTTSVLQPMDQGIIRSLKCHYRKKLMKHVITQSETNDVQAKDVQVDLLMVMNWCLFAWQSVTETTIKNCFRKAGFWGDECREVLDMEMGDEGLLSQLISHEVPEFPVTFEEYVSVDDSLIVSHGVVEDVTDATTGETTDEEQHDEDDGSEEILPPTRKQLLAAFSIVSRFNQSEPFVDLQVMDKVETAMLRYILETKKQTLITDFMTPAAK